MPQDINNPPQGLGAIHWLIYWVQKTWRRVNGISTGGSGGSGVTVGDPVTGGTASSFLYEDSGGLVAVGSLSATFGALISDKTGTTGMGAGLLVFNNNPTLAGVTFTDGTNINTGSVLGTVFGTSASQRIGFYGGGSVTQPGGDIISALQNLGLVSAPTLSVMSLTLPVTTVAYGTTTTLNSDRTKYLILVSGSSGATTVNLPTSGIAIGTEFLVKDLGLSASSNNITINAGASAVIVSSTSAQTYVISTNGEGVRIIYATATQWILI